MNIYLETGTAVEAEIKPIYEQENALVKNLFSGKEGEIFCLTSLEAKVNYTILIGLGKESKLTPEIIRNSFAKAIKKAHELKVNTIAIKKLSLSSLTETNYIQAMVEGMDLALYTFDKYKSVDAKKELLTIYLEEVQDKEQMNKIIQQTLNVTQSIKIARDMVNEPTNKLYPEAFAKRAIVAGSESGFQVEVLEEEAIRALGMEAFLTVGKGTPNKPRLIIMRHLKGESDEIIGLVGKGLTCDTGGYSLKGSESLMYMKSDMAGAASVIGVMSALAKNNIAKNVIAVVATCENVVAGDSYKPGDVIGSMAGKTIEVLNTDAEGRLTLADALSYIIEKEKVTKVIDIATLTGAAGTTFAGVYTAAISNNDAFYESFLTAAEQTGEDFWRLPTHKKYHRYIESDIADLKNTGGPGGGTITAAMFLEEFVKDIPWIHLDIAATAAIDPPLCEYAPKGGTGVAIRTLYTLLK